MEAAPMIEWLISFGNGCHYITMAFLLLYLLWLVRESFRTRKSGVVREEIMYSDDAGKSFFSLWPSSDYFLRENFPFFLYQLRAENDRLREQLQLQRERILELEGQRSEIQ